MGIDELEYNAKFRNCKLILMLDTLLFLIFVIVIAIAATRM